ncbi:MAG: hypothetical protein ABUK13_10640 [Gammaproteobacteria bacterium]
MHGSTVNEPKDGIVVHGSTVNEPKDGADLNDSHNGVRHKEMPDMA